MAFFAQIAAELPAITSLFGQHTKMNAEEILFTMRGPPINIYLRIRRKEQKNKLNLQTFKKIKKRKDSSTLTQTHRKMSTD